MGKALRHARTSRLFGPLLSLVFLSFAFPGRAGPRYTTDDPEPIPLHHRELCLTLGPGP